MNIGSFDLIKELGYENFSEENKKKILDSYSEALEIKISSRIMSELTEAQQKELDALIQAEKNAEADKYLTDNIEDLEFLVRDEVRKFKREVLVDSEQLKKSFEEFKKENAPKES